MPAGAEQKESAPMNLFYAYASPDARQRDLLEKHLSSLGQRGLLSSWHARAVGPGTGIQNEVSHEVERADVVLLLLSSDFVSSDYCHGPEVRRALERHRSGEARVIPVLLRPCNWKSTPFAGLPALPRDGKPVIRWSNADAAYQAIVAGITAASGGAAARGSGARTSARDPRPSGAPAEPATSGEPISRRAAAPAEPSPEQIALQPSELGPQFAAVETKGDGQSTSAQGTRYVTAAAAGLTRADARRVTQLVYRTASPEEAASRLEAGVRSEETRGAQREPLPAGLDRGQAVRLASSQVRPATTVSVFAAKGRFLVAAKVSGIVAGDSSSDDLATLAGSVVQRMLARITA
jgi:hypothetical protein